MNAPYPLPLSFARGPAVRRLAWMAGVFALAFAASAQAQSIHAAPRKTGGGGRGAGGNQYRTLPADYQAHSEQLKSIRAAQGLADAGGPGGDGVVESGAAESAVGHITQTAQKRKITPDQLGLENPADELNFIVHYCTSVSAAHLKSVIEPFLSGDGVVEAIAAADVLFVRDTPDSIVDIRRMIDAADRPQAQVMVEAQMIELRLDKDFEKDIALMAQRLGKISFGLAQAFGVPGDSPIMGNLTDQLLGASGDVINNSTYMGSNDRSAWSASRITDRSQIGLAVRFLEDRKRAKTLSNPRLITRRGKKASFLVGKEVPYYVYSDDSSSTSYAVQFKKIGIRLDVQPTLITCDTARLTVAPEVSAIDGYTDPGTGDNSYPRQPIILSRNVETEIEVKDGETIAIGGLFSTSDIKVRRSVPGLGAIPGIRHLFTSVHNIEERTQLVFFLTIRILNPGEPGGFVYPPTRAIPMRSMHDEYTHLQPKVFEGDPAHKWDNPEAILTPRRVELKYLEDGTILWNNTAERMDSNFPEMPCPTQPLLDPECKENPESPQRIRETWAPPGWPNRYGCTRDEQGKPACWGQERCRDNPPCAWDNAPCPRDDTGRPSCWGQDTCRGHAPCAWDNAPRIVADACTVCRGTRPTCTGRGDCPGPMARAVTSDCTTCRGARPTCIGNGDCGATVVRTVVDDDVVVIDSPAPRLYIKPVATETVEYVPAVSPVSAVTTTVVSGPVCAAYNCGRSVRVEGGYCARCYRSYPVITKQRCETPPRGQTIFFKDATAEGEDVSAAPLRDVATENDRFVGTQRYSAHESEARTYRDENEPDVPLGVRMAPTRPVPLRAPAR